MNLLSKTNKVCLFLLKIEEILPCVSIDVILIIISLVLSTNLPQAPSSPVSSPKELLENSIPSTPVSKEMGNPFGSPKPKKKYELEETPLRKSARLQQKTNHA